MSVSIRPEEGGPRPASAPTRPGLRQFLLTRILLAGTLLAGTLLTGTLMAGPLWAQPASASGFTGGIEGALPSNGILALGGALEVAPLSTLPMLGLVVRGQAGSGGDPAFQTVLLSGGVRLSPSLSPRVRLSVWGGGAYYREAPTGGDPRAPRAAVGPSGGGDIAVRLGPLWLRSGLLLHRGTHEGPGVENPIPANGSRFLLGLGW
jgi:hypothetical protein